MEVRHLIEALLRRWWLVLIPVVIVGAYTLATYQFPDTTYQVVMRFAAGTQPADELSPEYDRYYAWLASEYVANGLADVVNTLEFAQNVSGRLLDDVDVPIPPVILKNAFAGDNTQSTTVIYVTWRDGDEIEAIARAASEELIENAGYYYPQMAGVGDVARLLDDPMKVEVAPSLRAQLTGPALKLVLAFVLGAGLAVGVYMLDQRVYGVEDVEGAGVRVLGVLHK